MNIMRKLFLIVLIFLIMGAVSAHDDLNGTADSLLKDTEYSGDISDEDGLMEVEENGHISIEVNVDEAWSLNVYIDRHESVINDEIINAAYDRIDIPTSVMIDDEDVPLSLGKHNIIYEFKFTNTTSVYSPDAYISDSGVYFDFDCIHNRKNPQNSIYRFTSQFNIIKSVDPIVSTFDLDDINLVYSESLFFDLNGVNSGKVNIYIDDVFFNSFEIDENYYEEEIDISKLAVGSYNLVGIVESDNLYGDYKVNVSTSNDQIDVDFIKTRTILSPSRYISIFNTTLNICEFPELNSIYINAPLINISYTRSIPIYFKGNGGGDFVVYIDGEKVYDNTILLSWMNPCYIPTKDANGNYFREGTHDISFEFTPSDKYVYFNPEIFMYYNDLTFNFLNSHDSYVYLNDKYIINTKLNIINQNTQFNPIDSQDVVNIVHTDDIKLKIDNLSYYYNLTVFVDDVEIYDDYINVDEINIKTFLPRVSIDEANELDIETGKHSIRFEFKTLYNYDVSASFIDNTLHFKFKQNDSNINLNGVYYQFNTSLIVNEKQKTVHILKVKNNTYFDDTEFVVKMDLYQPDYDEGYFNKEDSSGLQDVGIIISNENGILYIGDYLMNIEHDLADYDFENEMLPKTGIYTIKIINLADNTYDTALFKVKKADRIFTKKYSSNNFNVLFTLDFSSCKDDLNEPCYITLNNEEKVINVKKGLVKSQKEVLFKDVTPGVYTAIFTLKGNEIYNDVTLKSKVIVKKEEPLINIHKTGENSFELTIDISKSKSDAILIVSAGGQQKEFTLDKNTKHIIVEFNNLESGNYNVEIDFKGNEWYSSKTLNTSIEISEYSEPPVSKPIVEDNKIDKKNDNGIGKDTGGVGKGSGNYNVTGTGNGTYNGKISFNGKGFNGDFGSQGSGHGDSVKSYEITKNIKEIENDNTLIMFLIIAFIILLLSFIYERREKDDSHEY